MQVKITGELIYSDEKAAIEAALRLFGEQKAIGIMPVAHAVDAVIEPVLCEGVEIERTKIIFNLVIDDPKVGALILDLLRIEAAVKGVILSSDASYHVCLHD